MKLSLGSALLVVLSNVGCAAGAEAVSTTGEAALTAGRPVDALASLAVDAAQSSIRFDYRTSGGCARHEAKAEVELTQTSGSSHAGKLRVLDVVEGGEDLCEAMISVSGSANLDSLVRTAAEEKGADVVGRSIPVELPPVLLSVRASQPSTAPDTGTVIDSVAALSTDHAGLLRFDYSVGGGCTAHTPSARAILSENADGMTVAKIEILDVTSAPDFCEALLSRRGSANLHELIAAAAAKTGANLTGHTIFVELPAVRLFPR